MYRRRESGIEVLLVHPGGPFWRKKDGGAWSIPKGEYQADEDALAAAKREFAEELGSHPKGVFLPLEEIRQAGGKFVIAWAVEGDLDTPKIRSNTFSMEWPPRSGKMQAFPEVDRAEWFPIETARLKILKSQAGLLDQFLKFVLNEPTKSP